MADNLKEYAEVVVLRLVNRRLIAPELVEQATKELEAAIRARLRQTAYNLAGRGAALLTQDRKCPTSMGN
jgi:hypothetical protein